MIYTRHYINPTTHLFVHRLHDPVLFAVLDCFVAAQLILSFAPRNDEDSVKCSNLMLLLTSQQQNIGSAQKKHKAVPNLYARLKIYSVIVPV